MYICGVTELPNTEIRVIVKTLSARHKNVANKNATTNRALSAWLGISFASVSI